MEGKAFIGVDGATIPNGLESVRMSLMGRLAKSIYPRLIVLSLTGLIAGSLGAKVQRENSSLPPPSQTIEPPSANNEIRVRANEVVVPVSVTDGSGELVLDLAQKDFRVFDEGVAQTIVHWDLSGDPLAVALVLETSSHIRMMAPVIHSLGSIFTETVMAVNGEAAVITYDETVDVRQPFTQDHDAVEKAISKTQFLAPQMKLYDGMSKAVDLLKAQPPLYRRIMLVVGESQDYQSDARLGRVVRQAELANIMIYAIGPSSTTADLRYGTEGGGGKKLTVKLPRPLPPISTEAPANDPLGRPHFDVLTPALWLLTRGTNEISNHQLEVAAAATGGIHYSALRDGTIRAALDQIGGELHAQYVLGYVPKESAQPGFHRIEVRVEHPNLTIRTRPGYYPLPSVGLIEVP